MLCGLSPAASGGSGVFIQHILPVSNSNGPGRLSTAAIVSPFKAERRQSRLGGGTGCRRSARTTGPVLQQQHSASQNGVVSSVCKRLS